MSQTHGAIFAGSNAMSRDATGDSPSGSDNGSGQSSPVTIVTLGVECWLPRRRLAEALRQFVPDGLVIEAILPPQLDEV